MLMFQIIPFKMFSNFIISCHRSVLTTLLNIGSEICFGNQRIYRLLAKGTRAHKNCLMNLTFFKGAGLINAKRFLPCMVLLDSLDF